MVLCVITLVNPTNYSSWILIFVGAARTVAQEGTNSSQRAQKYSEVYKEDSKTGSKKA